MRITDPQRLTWGKLLRERLENERQTHVIVGERIAKMEALDARLAAAVERVGHESSEESDALRALEAASDEAAKKLRLIGIKLEQAHLEGALDEGAYRAAMVAAFPHGTGVVGGGPGDRYNAARRVAAALEQHPTVDAGGTLATIAREAATELESRNVAAKKEAHERQEAHEALGRTRLAWDEAYQATKEILSGLLRDAGRLNDLRAIFPDLG